MIDTCPECKSKNITHYSEYNCCMDENCRANSVEQYQCDDCWEIYYREDIERLEALKELKEIGEDEAQ